MADPTAETRTPEAPRGPERETRAQVTEALNFGIQKLEEDIAAKADGDPQKVEEQRILESVNKAKGLTRLERGQGTHLVEFQDLETGAMLHLREGIPVNDLIEFLQRKANEATSEEEKANYNNQARILLKNSRPFLERPHRLDPINLLGRMRLEAKLISGRRRPDEQPDVDRDWFEAENDLARRRELVLPGVGAPEKPAEAGETPTTEEFPPEPLTAEDRAREAEELGGVGGRIARPAETARTEPGPMEGAGAARAELEELPEEPHESTIPEIKRTITIRMADKTQSAQKSAGLVARDMVQAELRRGSWWNPLNWARKVRIRVLEDHYHRMHGRNAVDFAVANNVSLLQTQEAADGSRRVVALSQEQEQAHARAKLEQFAMGRERSGETQVAAQSTLKKLLLDEVLTPIIRGEITEDRQLQQKLREFVRAHQPDPQIGELFGLNPNRWGEQARLFATDFLEAGTKLRSDYEAHTLALEQLDEIVEINLARADWLANRETHFNRTDRFIAWAQRGRIRGHIFNPAIVGIMSSLATFGLFKAVPRLAASRFAPYLMPGVGTISGAAYAAFRRSYDLKQEQEYQTTQETYGRTRPTREQVEAQIRGTTGWRGRLMRAPGFARMAGAYRQTDLERYAYNTASVDELRNGGGIDPLTGVARLRLRQLMGRDLSEGQDGNRRDLARRIAEIEERDDFSASNHIDLINFTSMAEVETGRLDLLNEAAAARLALQRPDLADEDINRVVGEYRTQYQEYFTTNRTEQDKAFRRYRIQQSFGAAAFGAAAGLTAGMLTQESIALIGRELGHDVGKTAFEKGVGAVAGVFGHEQKPHPDVTTFQDLFQHGGTVSTEHFQLNVGSDHLVNVVDPTTHQPITGLPHMELAQNGHIAASGNLDLPQSLQQELHDSNFQINPGQDVVHEFHRNLLTPAGSHDSIFPQTDQHVTIPNGTEWVQDRADPTKFDLVRSGDHRMVLVDSATIDKQGTLTFAHTYSEDPKAIGVEHHPGEFYTTTENRPTLGDHGVWTENATKIDHTEWYGYDKPGSQGNELRLYTFKNGNTVTLDASHMTVATEKGLTPNPIDVPQVIKDHRVVFAFRLHGHKDLLVVSDGSDGVFDGKLALDPNSTRPALGWDLKPLKMPDGSIMTVGQLDKLLVNENTLLKLSDGDIATELNGHYDVWNTSLDGQFGFIHAGDVYTNPSGHQVLQSFATIRGSSGLPSTIPVEVTHQTPAVNNIILNGPIGENIKTFTHNWEIIPPPSPGEVPPIIPVPFAPRHPLERLRNPIRGEPPYPPYFTPYERLSEEDREFYRGRLSERFHNNPEANLNPDEEIRDYFARQNPEYMRGLEAYLEQEGMREPMDDASDATVAIPVYALGEGQVVKNALEQYLLQIDKVRNKQAIDASKFEIIVFLNHPKNTREELESKLRRPYLEGAQERVAAGIPEPYDTEEVIKQFMAEHPELRIRVMKQEFEQRPQWGQIIKPLYDVTLLRSMRRTHGPHKDPTIITNDIDVVDMSPTYLRDILQAMDLNEIASSRDSNIRKIDGLAGKTDMPNQGYETEPGFLAAMRLYQFLDAQMRHRKDRVVITQGRNSALRGSTYAAVGGVNERSDAGADTELGRMVAYARNDPRTVRFLNNVWLQTDARRELDMWRKGIPLPYAWSEWEAMNTYGRNWKSRFNIPPSDPSKIDRRFLETEINVEIQRWELNPRSREITRALAYLGLKPSDYHVATTTENGQPREVIVVDRIDGLVKNLKSYVKEKRWETATKRKEEAVKRLPSAPVTDRFIAQYLNYEEFDRLYEDIFHSREYPWQPDPSVESPTIIDLGSHIGMSVLFWKSLSPKANIVAVEPNPQTAEVLIKNIGNNNLQNVSVIQAATSASDGRVNLYMPKSGVDFRWGDFTGRTPTDMSRYDVVSVPSVRLSSLIRGPVDLLKVDIEGAELEVIREAESKLPQVKEVMLEFHNNPENPANSFSELMDILRRQGYNIEVRQWNQPIDPATLDLSQQLYLTVLAKRPSLAHLPAPTATSAPVSPPPTSRPAPTARTTFETATPTPVVSLPERINSELRRATADTAVQELTSADFDNYIRSAKLPAGAKMKEMHTEISGSRMITAGTISVPLGKAVFNAVLENDPVRGGLKVVSHNVDLSGTARTARGTIEANIENLNGIILGQIEAQIDRNWQVAGIRLEDDHLVIAFQKRLAAAA